MNTFAIASVGDFEIEERDEDGHYPLHNCYTDEWWYIDADQLKDLKQLFEKVKI